jgi:dGTPase
MTFPYILWKNQPLFSFYLLVLPDMMNWEKLLRPIELEQKGKDSPDQYRSEFERDFDRIVFSSPFRNLQDKTQVFPLPENDFVHTRLTHSLEVSSVGRSLGKIAGEFLLEKYPELTNCSRGSINP